MSRPITLILEAGLATNIHMVCVPPSIKGMEPTMENLYERSAEQFHTTGRDLWVFAKHGTGWLGGVAYDARRKRNGRLTAAGAAG